MDTSMKSIFVKINGITDATTLCKKASVVDGDIEIRKGRWCVDAKSIMGIMSIDLSTGATAVYPEDAKESEDFIKKFEAK